MPVACIADVQMPWNVIRETLIEISGYVRVIIYTFTI